MPPVGFIQSELDLKFLVLYIMARTADAITFHELLDLALCDAGVDYFSLTQAVDHMLETGQLRKDELRYAITEKGRRNSEICQNSLPYSVRLHCDKNLRKLNDMLRRQAQVQTDVQDNPDGTCTLRLLLQDEDSPLLQVSLLTPNQEQAAHMAERFLENPSRLLHAITGLLTQTEPL